MKSLVVVSLVVSSVASADPKPTVDVTTAQLAALATAAKCEDAASPFRPWCIATKFETGTAAALPKGKVLVGMTIELETGKPAGDALTQKVSFVALAIGKDGKVKLTDVKPESPDEEKAVAEAVFNTSAVFKGKAKTSKLPKELATYFATLKGAYNVKKSGKDWTWSGASASRMRKVGDAWVVIEVPTAGNGVFVTILTPSWE